MSKSDAHTPIKCRSKESPNCYDGRDESSVYEEGQEDDGTWDGESVICDACYITLGQPVIGQPEFVTGKKAGQRGKG